MAKTAKAKKLLAETRKCEVVIPADLEKFAEGWQAK